MKSFLGFKKRSVIFRLLGRWQSSKILSSQTHSATNSEKDSKTGTRDFTVNRRENHNENYRRGGNALRYQTSVRLTAHRTEKGEEQNPHQVPQAWRSHTGKISPHNIWL